METNKNYNIKCEDGLKQLESNSIDFICIDPPYTDGNINVLEGHKIQTNIDVLNITKEHYRVLKNNSFYAVFGQMPTILSWYNAALECGFNFKIDIIWCKKKGSQGGNLKLKRSHELIYIFTKGNLDYYKTDGNYSDVSQALCENNLKDIQTIFRNLNYWKSLAQNKDVKNTSINTTPNDKYFANKGLDKKESQTLGLENLYFNSVWAFSTHNTKHRNPEEGQIKHPSVKSIPLLERLIELCSKEDSIVLDSFIGSGTTSLACINTNRKYIGFEIDKDYFDICNNRIGKTENKLLIDNIFEF